MYNPTGFIDPLNNTLSMYLVYYVKFIYKSLEISRGTPNYLLLDSNLAAIFTFGLKYDASILNYEPIAPSIPQPECSP